MIRIIGIVSLAIIVVGFGIYIVIIAKQSPLNLTLDSITVLDRKVTISGAATRIKELQVLVKNPKGQEITVTPQKFKVKEKSGKFNETILLFAEETLFKDNNQFVSGEYQITVKPDKAPELAKTTSENVAIPDAPNIEQANYDNATQNLTGKINSSSTKEYRVIINKQARSGDTPVDTQVIDKFENDRFSVQINPSDISTVTITAVNWAGKKSDSKTVDIPNPEIILQVEPIRLVRDPTAPPVIPVTVSGRISVNYPPVTLRIIQPESQQREIQVGRDGRFSTTVNFNPASEIISLQATDGLGNTKSETPPIIPLVSRPQIQLDPVYVINIPVSFPITVEVRGIVSDDSGIASVRLISPYPSNDVTLEGDGRFTVTVQIRRNEDWNNIRIRATDLEGNSTDATVRIIRVRLQITVVPPPVITNQTQISIRGRVEVADPYRHLLPDAIQKLTATFPQFRFQSDGNFEFTADLPIEGRNVIRFPLDGREFPVIRDTIPPQIQVTTLQPDQVITETSVDVTGQVIEANLEGLYINDEKVTDQPGEFSRNVSGLRSGRQNISIKAIDRANNPPTNKQIEIMVDLEKPKIEVIDSPKEVKVKKVKVGELVEIVVKATDDTQVTRVEISGKGVEAKMKLDEETGQYKHEFTTTNEQIGDLPLRVTAFDLANRQSEPQTKNVLVEKEDTTPPTFASRDRLSSLTKNSDGSYSLTRYIEDGDFYVNVSDADSGIREVKLNDSPIEGKEGLYMIQLTKLRKESDGKLTGLLIAVDNVGSQAKLEIIVIVPTKDTAGIWSEVYINLFIKNYGEAEKSLNEIAKLKFAPTPEVNLFQGIIRYHQGVQSKKEVALPKYDEAINSLLEVESLGRNAFKSGSDFFHEMRYYLGMSYYNKWVTINQMGRNDTNLRNNAVNKLNEFVREVNNVIRQGVRVGRQVQNNKKKAEELLSQ